MFDNFLKIFIRQTKHLFDKQNIYLTQIKFYFKQTRFLFKPNNMLFQPNKIFILKQHKIFN